MITIPERSAGHLRGGLTGSAVFEENLAGDFTVFALYSQKPGSVCDITIAIIRLQTLINRIQVIHIVCPPLLGCLFLHCIILQ